MDERRRYERIELPASANVVLLNSNGALIGRVRVLGQGGLLVETKQPFEPDTPHHIIIADASQGIRRDVPAIARYIRPEGVGFQFVDLSVDAAVELGVLIGKYYSAAQEPQSH